MGFVGDIGGFLFDAVAFWAMGTGSRRAEEQSRTRRALRIGTWDVESVTRVLMAVDPVRIAPGQGVEQDYEQVAMRVVREWPRDDAPGIDPARDALVVALADIPDGQVDEHRLSRLLSALEALHDSQRPEDRVETNP